MKILIGDMLKSRAQTLINTVNCVGIMGKGIALEFKKHFPEMFADYVQRCERQAVRPGVPYIFKALYPPHVINFPTKDHWKSMSKIKDIEQGLAYLLVHYREWGVTSLAIPPLGCGNGQLEWKQVGPLIYKCAKQMDIPVEMYAPYGTNPRELTEEFLEQLALPLAIPMERQRSTPINPAWVALVEILYRIEQQPYHWPVGRTIFQKIAYVASRAGLPTGFLYAKGSFGPFSSDLKAAEARLVNNNLLQEERHGGMFEVKVGPNYETVRKNFRAEIEQWSAIIEKTTDLFVRMNTDQAEVVATVIFSADILQNAHAEIPSETDVLGAVMQWKQKRRPPLNPSDVIEAIRNLGMLRWLRVKLDANLSVTEEDAVPASSS
jgi:O-acetyl-ADP-ribose deacetylase (regulator of RNase III)/uncharacterized protein YwgA